MVFAPYGIVLGEENARTVGEPLTSDPSQHCGQAASAEAASAGTPGLATGAAWRTAVLQELTWENHS